MPMSSRFEQRTATTLRIVHEIFLRKLQKESRIGFFITRPRQESVVGVLVVSAVTNCVLERPNISNLVGVCTIGTSFIGVVMDFGSSFSTVLINEWNDQMSRHLKSKNLIL